MLFFEYRRRCWHASFQGNCFWVEERKNQFLRCRDSFSGEPPFRYAQSGSERSERTASVSFWKINEKHLQETTHFDNKQHYRH